MPPERNLQAGRPDRLTLLNHWEKEPSWGSDEKESGPKAFGRTYRGGYFVYLIQYRPTATLPWRRLEWQCEGKPAPLAEGAFNPDQTPVQFD